MKPTQPNIIWIFPDQMRAQATSYAGDPNVSTPNLDRLALESVHFTHAVSGTPWCTPFRGALLTGRYPHRSGVPASGYALPPESHTVAHVLKAHGYRTCYIGKWHLDGHGAAAADGSPESGGERKRVILPERRGGFEDWWAYENNNRPFDCWIHSNRSTESAVGAGQVSGTTPALAASSGPFPLGKYETDGLTDILIDWLKERTNAVERRPFFSVLSMQPPHSPYSAPADNMARHHPANIRFRANVPPVERVRKQAARELAGYYAAIERLDRNVGRIRETLRELGLSENTYLMFFSDHGDMHGSHGLFRKSCPWEEAIRIPMIIGGPSRNHQRPKELDYPLNHVDIAPTTLGLCGIPAPDEMDGHDYSPYVLGTSAAQAPPDSAYLSVCIPSQVSYAVDRPFRGVVTRDGWKYCVLEGQPWLLFNLNEDPYELVNLAHVKAFHHQRRRLQERLAQWIAQTEDRFDLPAADREPV